MNINRILGKGYFAKELPPPFETIEFANKSSRIFKKWENTLNTEKQPKGTESATAAKKRYKDEFIPKYSTSKCISFSYTKGLYSRRRLDIPNPIQYYNLANYVVKNWKKIRETYSLSEFSASTPIESDSERAVRTKSRSLNNFKFLLIEKSFNKKYELRLDISQYYPSVYTHSITWAIMGKANAKKYFALKSNPRTNWQTLLTTDSHAQLYDFCNSLDTLVRDCQEKQSIGLPIGPDVSFILAEIIGNRIDSEIQKKASDIDFQCSRYYDDYYFYIDTYNDAERLLKIVQNVLNEFQLETNESKVKIKKLPFSFEPKWNTILAMYRFKKINQYEIRNFFSVIFNLIEEYPEDSSWIVSYALGRFEYGNVGIPLDTWDIFLNLLSKTLLIDSSNIDQFFKIILSYKTYLTKNHKDKISKVLHRIIEEHFSLNHSFEVSWSLWILKSLSLKIDNILLLKILNSDDQISKIICLDIVHSKLYKGKKISLSSIERNLSPDDLRNEKWLFTYEGITQGWLKEQSPIITNDEYFKILNSFNVKFYNPNNQIKPEFLIDINKLQISTDETNAELNELFKYFRINTIEKQKEDSRKLQELTILESEYFKEDAQHYSYNDDEDLPF